MEFEVVTFKEVKTEIGFGLAVRVFQNKLPSGFWEEINLDQAIKVYNAAVPNSSLQKKAFAEVKNKAEKTFEGWKKVYWKAHRSSLARMALSEMKKLAESFEEKAEIYDLPETGELKKEMLAEMVKLVSSFWEWAKIYTCTPSVGKLRETALDDMMELAQTPKELLEFLRSTSTPSFGDREIILAKAIELSKTSEELSEIITWIPDHLPLFNELKQKAHSKMVEIPPV